MLHADMSTVYPRMTLFTRRWRWVFQVDTVVHILKKTDGVNKGSTMKIVRVAVDGVCALQPPVDTGTIKASFKNVGGVYTIGGQI